MQEGELLQAMYTHVTWGVAVEWIKREPALTLIEGEGNQLQMFMLLTGAGFCTPIIESK